MNNKNSPIDQPFIQQQAPFAQQPLPSNNIRNQMTIPNLVKHMNPINPMNQMNQMQNPFNQIYQNQYGMPNIPFGNDIINDPTQKQTLEDAMK